MKPINNPKLDEAIAHWWDNVRRHDAKEHYFTDAEHCALCQERSLWPENDKVDCTGIGTNVPMCPIMARTHRDGCEKTPWTDVAYAKVHPVVMAWWLEDLKAGRAPLISDRGVSEALRGAFSYMERRRG